MKKVNAVNDGSIAFPTPINGALAAGQRGPIAGQTGGSTGQTAGQQVGPRVNVISDIMMMSAGRMIQTSQNADIIDDVIDDINGSVNWMGDIIIDVVGSNWIESHAGHTGSGWVDCDWVG